MKYMGSKNRIRELFEGDCLEIMPEIPDGSIDMILADLPYGTTQNKWDSVIPLDLLWKQYNRVIKYNGAIVLVMSNPKMFKYEWVWDKINKFSGHLNAKKQPIRQTERINVFYKKQCVYNPIMEQGEPYTAISSGGKSGNFGKQTDKVKTISNGRFILITKTIFNEIFKD
jgi:hypothetical protein